MVCLARGEAGRIAQVDAPPYSIANNNVRLPLSFRAIPVTARHHDGSLQYDTHNLYGLSHAAATYRALDTIHAGPHPESTLNLCVLAVVSVPCPHANPSVQHCDVAVRCSSPEVYCGDCCTLGNISTEASILALTAGPALSGSNAP